MADIFYVIYEPKTDQSDYIIYTLKISRIKILEFLEFLVVIKIRNYDICYVCHNYIN